MKKLRLTAIISLIIFTTIQLQASSKSSLKEYHPSKIGLRCDTSLLLPNTVHKIGLVVFTEEGNILKTKGLLNGSLSWRNISIEMENASFFYGYLKISKECSKARYPFVPLKISFKYHPEKIFYDTIWLNYEKSIKIFSNNYFKKIPGAKVKFGLEVKYDNEKTELFRTDNEMKKILPNYEVLVKGGWQNDDEFIISNNIFDNPDHKPGFLVQLRKDSNVYDTHDIQLDYRERYNYYCNGSSGMFGFSGFSGSSGAVGQHGAPGQDGKNGSHGNHGHDIDIYADAYYDTILQTTLLKIYTYDLTTNKENHYLINPLGGSFTVNASGGSGGDGGNGGSGGNGGKGYNGEYYTEYIKETITKKDTAGREYKVEITKAIERQKPGGDGGFGGPGGYGGIGGDGGNGGSVMIYYTANMTKYLNLLNASVNGGSGGQGGNGAAGGIGAAGGNGNPKGRNGGNGPNGMNGPWGYNGANGRIELKEVTEIPW